MIKYDDMPEMDNFDDEEGDFYDSDEFNTYTARINGFSSNDHTVLYIFNGTYKIKLKSIIEKDNGVYQVSMVTTKEKNANGAPNIIDLLEKYKKSFLCEFIASIFISRYNYAAYTDIFHHEINPMMIITGELLQFM